MKFGVHMAQKGGFKTNVERVAGLGCQTIQIFPGNPTGWKMGKLDQNELKKRTALLKTYNLDPLVVHSAYLINLATTSADFLAKSRLLLRQTMERARDYGSPFVILHTGNHGGQGPEEGLLQIVSVISEDYKTWPAEVKLLLENTAGSGTALGARFEDLAHLLSHFPDQALGVCLDTAHGWAAGYDFSTAEGVENTLNDFDDQVGLDNLKVIHVNDTKVERGSKLDRHAHIGAGSIGRNGFSALLKFGWPHDLPVILETPENGSHWDRINLEMLHELAGTTGDQKKTDHY